MGKRLFQAVYASQKRTDVLAVPDLMVVGETGDDEHNEMIYHTVHKSYFSKERPSCPYCGNLKTTETKIRPRKFKDILPTKNGENNVIDLVFHQRFFRCNDCGRVFRERIDFAEESCRFTNRLSDILADGTLTQSYEQVCKEYGVPSSKTSVGIIMRRRLQMKIDRLPPLATPEALTIFVAYYYSTAYPIVLGIYGERVQLIEILSESSEVAYSKFFSKLEKSKVKQVYIDPEEPLNNAVVDAFPAAQIMISEECIRRYIRDALKEAIKKEGPKCTIYQRYHTLTKPESYLLDFEQRKVERTMGKRHRLAAAYYAYQDQIQSMGKNWDIGQVIGWVDSLPDYLSNAADDGEVLEPLIEFDIVKDVLHLFETQVNTYLALKKKPPAEMTSAVMNILDSLEKMPFCIYDVLHARMLLNVEHDEILKDGKKYRIGVPVGRLTKKMHDIADEIMKMRENE